MMTTINDHLEGWAVNIRAMFDTFVVMEEYEGSFRDIELINGGIIDNGHNGLARMHPEIIK